MRRPLDFVHRQSGISYVEVLAAIIVIALTAVPAATALRGAMHTSEVAALATVNHYRLFGKMEEVLAEPFSVLAAQAAGTAIPTAYSDAVASIDRRLVFISLYDGDNADADNDPFTDADAGLLWVRVEVEGTVVAIASLQADR